MTGEIEKETTPANRSVARGRRRRPAGSTTIVARSGAPRVNGVGRRGPEESLPACRDRRPDRVAHQRKRDRALAPRRPDGRFGERSARGVRLGLLLQPDRNGRIGRQRRLFGVCDGPLTVAFLSGGAAAAAVARSARKPGWRCVETRGLLKKKRARLAAGPSMVWKSCGLLPRARDHALGEEISTRRFFARPPRCRFGHRDLRAVSLRRQPPRRDPWPSRKDTTAFARSGRAGR